MGIDPGTGRIGYGLIECKGNKMSAIGYGCLTTPANQELSLRLVTIFQELQQIIKQYKPDAVAVEKLFFARNVTTAMSVGEARGVIILAAALNNQPIFEYTPLQVKQAVTGYGRAEKGQIQRMVSTILEMQETPRPDDAADALAIAITCAVTNIRYGSIARSQ